MVFAFVCLGISAFCFIMFAVWYFTYYKKRDEIEQKIKNKEKQTSNKSFGKIITVLGVIAIIIGIILIITGSSQIGAYPLVIGLIPLIVGYNIQKDANKDEQHTQAIELTKDYADFRDGIVYLKKRNSNLRKIITIDDHYIGKLKYNPETIHYGSVTVGGVTTGGVYKTGGDYSSITKKSEMKHMCYDGHIIVDIELTDELCQKAKTSYISKYLDGKRIQVMGREFLSYTPTSIEQVEIGKGSGTPLDKCNDILNWICGLDR